MARMALQPQPHTVRMVLQPQPHTARTALQLQPYHCEDGAASSLPLPLAGRVRLRCTPDAITMDFTSLTKSTFSHVTDLK